MLNEFAAFRITAANSSGTLLDNVARKSSPQTLLEEVKFYFYYIEGHIKVLAAGLDQEADLRGGSKNLITIFSVLILKNLLVRVKKVVMM